MKKYTLPLNEGQKELLDHAINFCIDMQWKMGAITPKMALGLIAIQNQVKEIKSK